MFFRKKKLSIFPLVLYENLAAALQCENLNFLCDTITLIGECNFLSADIGNAIHAYKELVPINYLIKPFKNLYRKRFQTLCLTKIESFNP